MAGSRGGAREGAGRKPNAEKYAEQKTSFTGLCAEYLLNAFGNLKQIAEGMERIEQKWVPAGTVTRKEVLRMTVTIDEHGEIDRSKDGQVWLDKSGKPVCIEVPVFPQKDADEMVLIERKVSRSLPDFKANQLIIDRAMGTVIPAPEEPQDLVEIRQAVEGALDILAARKSRPPDVGGPPPPPTPPPEADDDDDLD